MVNPATTASAPHSIDTTIISGTRRVSNDAVAGGPTSRPNTSSVPTAWKLATMLMASSTISAKWAALGCMPSERAFIRLKVSARNGR